MPPRQRAEAGFTLIELLVVICILSILIGLSVVGTVYVLNASRANSTEALLKDMAAACVAYQQRWGDYPPSSIEEIGGRAPNDLNSGVETLVACLSSRKRGGPFFQKDDFLCNVDVDSADRNLTDWYYKTNELFEVRDHFDRPIVYFHHKDFEKPKMALIQYKLAAQGEEYDILPEIHPTTKTFMNAGRFQIRSVGRDGKPGTGDDLRAP